MLECWTSCVVAKEIILLSLFPVYTFCAPLYFLADVVHGRRCFVDILGDTIVAILDTYLKWKGVPGWL